MKAREVESIMGANQRNPRDATARSPTDGLVPIVVGVSGHRDIPEEDRERLTAVLRQQLVQIATAHPSSPCILLTGLAEGADRLAAHCALAAGWGVGAILPRPQAIYETDFADDASRTEFRTLLSRCDWVREVAPAGTPHPACYRLLGEWLAYHSQQAIVLWDGVPSAAIGGTADVVKLVREGMPQERLILPDTRPVIHILTRRIRDYSAIADGAVGTVTRLDPQPAGIRTVDEAERWESIWKRIDNYNRHARLVIASEQEGITRVRNHLNGGAPIVDTECSRSAKATSWLYATASTISTAARTQRDRLFLLMIGFAVLAIFLEHLSLEPWPWPGLLAAAIVSGLLGLGGYWYAQRKHLEDRYLDYRALAEACRVQYFWKRAEVAECVANHFLRDQRDALEWLRQAVITTQLGPNEPPAVTLSLIEQVRNHWIVDQLRFFAGTADKPGKAEQNEASNRRWGNRAFRFLLAGVVVTLVVTLFHGFAMEHLGELGEEILQGLIITYGMLFAAAGVSKVYQETQAFGEQANRYQCMALSMQLARRQIDSALGAKDLNLAQRALVAIGREALAENGDWLLIHRKRPVKVPLGG